MVHSLAMTSCILTHMSVFRLFGSKGPQKSSPPGCSEQSASQESGLAEGLGENRPVHASSTLLTQNSIVKSVRKQEERTFLFCSFFLSLSLSYYDINICMIYIYIHTQPAKEGMMAVFMNMYKNVIVYRFLCMLCL